MKIVIVVLLLLISCLSYSNPAVDFSVHSYLGGYFYPDRDDKEFSYFDKQDIRLGITGLKKEPINLDIYLKYSERLQDERIGLHSLFLVYQESPGWSLSFQIDNIGYGEQEEIFERDITSPDYDLYRLGDFRFTGIRYDNKISSLFNSSFRIGGNVHNSSIGSATLSFIKEPVDIGLFYLYLGRDSNFNKTMHSGGIEFKLQRNILELNLYQTWQHLSSTFTTSNYLAYGELLFHLKEKWQMGGNAFYAKKLRGYNDWQEYSLVTAYRWDTLENTVQYLFYRVGDMKADKLATILSYSLSDSFSLGLNSAIHFPETGKNYYTLGLQVKIYEIFPL